MFKNSSRKLVIIGASPCVSTAAVVMKLKL